MTRIAKLARHISASAMLTLVPLAAAFAQDLTGAGATFPDPIYKKWFGDYAAKTHIQINYQAIGSGGGIKQLQEQTVDFGASDAPASDAELAAMKGGPVFHIPMVMGAVVPTYNVVGLSKLQLTADTLSGIYLGTIKTWNDPKIAADNAGVTLPSASITVVFRSDGSGTTGVFTDITYIQRLNTAGGPAPTTTCDSTSADVRIPYSADYYFFTGGAADGGTNG